MSDLSTPQTTIEIPLAQNKVAIIDACDADLVAMKWHASKIGRCWYVYRYGNGKKIYLHRVIAERVGIDLDEHIVDHANHDGLDNRRSNIRAATKRQNQQNQRKRIDNTSGFKGVFWASHANMWRAMIGTGKDRRRLGYFKDVHDAARAYNKAAIEIHGEFACLNIIE